MRSKSYKTKAIRAPDPQVMEFLRPYDPSVVELAFALRRMAIEAAPTAIEIVYDAYSAVSIGFSFTGRLKEMFLHIAVYRDHVNLGFNWGADLPDPKRLLIGKGSQVRHLTVSNPEDLKQPHLLEFIGLAIDRSLMMRGPAPPQTPVIIKVVQGNKRRPSAADLRINSRAKD